MKDIFESSFESRYENLDTVGTTARMMSLEAGFDDEAAGWVELSVREAMINAIKHGNHEDSAKTVDVRIEACNNRIDITVRDHGPGFDPKSIPDPLDPDNLLQPAGRGILLMRTFMENVKYSRHPDGGMIVVMSKTKPVHKDH